MPTSDVCFVKHTIKSVLKYLLYIGNEISKASVRRHTPVAARRQRYRPNLNSVRCTGTLKLLNKEPFYKGMERRLYIIVFICPGKCSPRNPKNFRRRISESYKIIKEEIMKLVCSQNVLRALTQLLPMHRGNQFRRNRRIKYITQYRRKLFTAQYSA